MKYLLFILLSINAMAGKAVSTPAVGDKGAERVFVMPGEVEDGIEIKEASDVPHCEHGAETYICCPGNTKLQMVLIGAGFSHKAEWYCIPLVPLVGALQVTEAFVTKDLDAYRKAIAKVPNVTK